MRKWLLAAGPAMLLAHGACADGVQLALDGAADLSPIYPTVTIPANERDPVVIFDYGDRGAHRVTTTFTSNDAQGPLSMSPEAQIETVAIGAGTRFLVRRPFLGDPPVGDWTVTAAVDGRPVGSVAFKVVPPAPAAKPPEAAALAGSLSPGTIWDYRYSLTRPLDGNGSAHAQDTITSTLLRRIASLDPDGARRDEQLEGQPATSSWLLATDRGLAITRLGSQGQSHPLVPPQIIAPVPDGRFQRAWQWRAAGDQPDQAQQFQMWGPLPVRTPTGVQPGYIVLQKVPDPDHPKMIAGSFELSIVPGVGVVHETVVQRIPGADAFTRIQLDLAGMTRGPGPGPAPRPYPFAASP